MKLLIVYGTTEGQTRKIAEYIKAEAIKAGTETILCDTTENPVKPDGFDAVIICASMHMQRYQTSAADYIRTHYAALNDKPATFVSVSLSALGDGYDAESYQELKDITAKFLEFTHWKPWAIEYVAGALRFTKYDFMKKYIMRLIAQKAHHPVKGDEDIEYTNWQQVSGLVARLIAHAKITGSKLAEEIL